MIRYLKKLFFLLLSIIFFNLLFIYGTKISTVPLSLFSEEEAQQEKQPYWSCNAFNICVITNVARIHDDIRYESQNDCHLSCGTHGSIWPMPTGDCSLSSKRIHFDPWKVRFNVAANSSATKQFLGEAKRIFLSNIIKECLTNCTVPNSKDFLIKLRVHSSSLILDWTTDETYTLNIGKTDIGTLVNINAETVYGVRLALETLSNLITGSIKNGLLTVATAHIQDGPVFSHRGLLLDTSRNFMPLHQIRKTLDAMATSKLNVFHWHVVDSHSFPLEITRVPEMQRFGAYSTSNTYSRKDAINIIKYARLRGIRVLIEIDGPSHSSNGWQWGPMAELGNLTVCTNQKPWRLYCIQPPCGQLNPMNDNMYLIMKEIYEEIAEISAPEETIHMGGDEVYIPCWNNTEEITNKMLSIGFDLSLTSFYKIWSMFHEKNLQSWDQITRQQYPQIKKPKSVIVWSSHLTNPDFIENYLPKNRFIIQTWVQANSSLNTLLLSKGYRLILSTVNAWYLDHGFWGQTSYYNWAKVYDNNIQKHPNVLGGEVCMWSEYVDQFGVENRVWPRAGAAAERLWSNPSQKPKEVQYRFYRYRDRLISRGIRPEAVIPKWCILNEYECL